MLEVNGGSLWRACVITSHLVAISACTVAPVEVPVSLAGRFAISLGPGQDEAPRGLIPAENSGPTDGPVQSPSPTGLTKPLATPAATPGTEVSVAGRAGGGRSAQVSGRVVAFDPRGAESPLAGASVATSDGRVTSTDGDGTFAFAGPLPADGALVASLPGFVTSAVAGLPAGPVTLHLQPRAGQNEEVRPGREDAFLAYGTVVDLDGAPRPGVVVVLEDARGAYSTPAVSGADGAFILTVFAPEGRVEDGTLLVVGTPGDEWLGVAPGLSFNAADGAVDADPTTPAADPVRVARADHPLSVNVDAAGLSGLLDVNVYMVGPGGISLSLPGEPMSKLVADLPGVSYELQAEIVDPVAGTRAALRQELLPINFAAASTVIAERLLVPPVIAPFDPNAPGVTVAWAPVPEARGFRLTLAGLDGQGFVWEGFTEGLSLAPPMGQELAPGRWSLTVAAWDRDDLTSRSVAALPDRRLALRLMPRSGRWRTAARQVVFSR